MRIDRRVVTFVRCVGIVLAFCSSATLAQQHRQQNFFTPSDTLKKSRVALVSGTWIAIYGTSLVALNDAWYNKYPRTAFHSFNDLSEWNQMDKAGHAWTAYTESKWTADAFKWSGVKQSTADAVGAATALAFQTTLELLDAHSAKWGFSWSDEAANVIGAGIYFAQARCWHAQRAVIKYSFHPIDYKKEVGTGYNAAAMRRLDDLYGSALAEEMLKDYNGQTYWLSVNPSSFVARFKPRWLNIAIGYGAENMIGGRTNMWTANGVAYDYSNLKRTRQFYLSPDIDFTRIQTNSSLLKTFFEMVNVIKFPAPALMLDNRGALKFYPVYF